VHDGEGSDLAGASQSTLLELAFPAGCTSIAPIEEQSPALGALVGNQVWLVIENQIVHHRDLVSH